MSEFGNPNLISLFISTMTNSCTTVTIKLQHTVCNVRYFNWHFNGTYKLLQACRNLKLLFYGVLCEPVMIFSVLEFHDDFPLSIVLGKAKVISQ